MKPNFNIIMIDLTVFNRRTEIEEFLISCNLQDKISYKHLWALKHGMFTDRKVVFRVWYDATTFNQVAYSLHKEQNFNKDFINFLLNVESLKHGEKIEVSQNNDVEELTVDNILDKIRTKGINSLTQEEKNFLDSM